MILAVMLLATAFIISCKGKTAPAEAMELVIMNGEGRAEDVAIRALDDRTFEVTMVGPVPYALAMIGHYSFSPLPMHAIEKFGVNWTRHENFVGNGPFILQEYIPNSRIVVVPINCQDHAPLRDPRVREALSMGFDREELTDQQF